MTKRRFDQWRQALQRSFILFMSFLTLSSCGIGGPLDFIRRGEGYTRQFSTTDTTFTSYISRFENEASQKLNQPNFKVGDIPINFGDTENPEYVGICLEYTNGQREIIIKQSWWQSATEEARIALIFHELGHCRLDRGHDDETFNNGTREIRLSIMHSRMVYLNDYRQYQDQYHKELYTGRNADLLERLRRN